MKILVLFKKTLIDAEDELSLRDERAVESIVEERSDVVYDWQY